MGAGRLARALARAQQNAVALANPGAALGLSLAGGVNLGGALGVGGVPVVGFGAGTPLAGLLPFASVFNSPVLADVGLQQPVPWSALGYYTSRGKTSFGIPPGYERGGLIMPGFNFGTFLGSNGGLQPINATSSGSGSWMDIFSQGLNVLGQYEATKLAMKENTRQFNRQLKLAQLGVGPSAQQGAAAANPYSPIANPYMAQNPNIGGGGTSSPYGFVQQNVVPQWYTGLGLDGAVVGGAAGAATGGGIGAAVGGPIGAVIGEAAGGAAGAALGGMVMQGGAMTVRHRAPRLVGSIDNNTGRSVFYRYVGAPILFRGDLSTLRTVKRAVGKFGGLARATSPRFRRRRR